MELILADQIALSNELANSSLLPKEYQRNPANLLYAIQFAKALGIEPINAVTGIHVISGKPSLSADLMAAQVRRAGHKLRVVATDQTATATLIRRDDPDFEFTTSWTMERAQTAGLLSNPSWKKFPAAMLRSRAVSEVIRMSASEVLHGAIYTPDELATDAKPVVSVSSTERLKKALEAHSPQLATAAQITKLQILRTERGLERDAFLAGASAMIGREISSSKNLTKSEAASIIDRLENQPVTEPTHGE